MYDFESHIVDIPDYPEPGVVFKDITPLFGNPEALKAMVDALAEHFADMGITKVVGPEARGFMFGVPVAVALEMPALFPHVSRVNCRARRLVRATSSNMAPILSRSMPMPLPLKIPC